MRRMDLLDAQLCFVKENVAYFTTRSLDEQGGDDWGDIPYEHNAGAPYEAWRDDEDWAIVRVAFDDYGNGTHLVDPSHGHMNSPFSVVMINRDKKVPWLVSLTGTDTKLYAGTTLLEFTETLTSLGLEVHLPLSVFHDGSVPAPGPLVDILSSTDPEARVAALQLVRQLGGEPPTGSA